MSSGKTAAEIGIPREKIEEALKSFSSAKLRVSRRNDKGQVAQLYGNVPIPLELLFEIDSFLEPLCGGGSFRIEAENPNGTTPLHVVPPFIVNIEAPPRPRVPLAPPQYDEQGRVLPPRAGMPAPTPQVPWGAAPPAYPQYPSAPPQQYGPTVPQYGDVPGSAWAQGLAPEQANAYIGAGNQMYAPHGNPFSRPMAPAPAKDTTVNNPVYDNFVAQMRGQLAKAEAEATSAREKYADLQQRTRDEHEKLIREHERKIDEMRRQHELDIRRAEDIHREKLQAREEKHYADEKTWERERQDLRDRALRAEMQATSAANQPRGSGMAEFIVPLVPALTAMINQNGERDRAERANQIEMMKLQMSHKGENPVMDIFKTAMPLILPLLQQSMQNKSPDAIAALLEATQNSQMQAIGMTMQMIEAMQPDEKPVWAQALLGFLGQLQGVGEKLFEKWEQPQPQQMRSLPQGGGGGQRHEATQRPPLRVVKDPVVEEIETMVMPFVPASFQTREWRDIIVSLRRQDPREKVVELLATHLAMLIKQNMLPPEIGGFVEAPTDSLDSLIRPLMAPLGLSQEYVVPIMLDTLAVLSRAELIKWSPPNGMEESDGETLEEAGVHDQLDYEPSEA